MSDIILNTVGLYKQFGALSAVDQATIDFKEGEVHVIIGPNGAGKTTLINLLSGDLLPTGGTITYKGQEITDLPPNKISLLGIGRSYQKTNIFPEFTCKENCWLAGQSRQGSSMKFFKAAARLKEVHTRAEKGLEMAGLSHQANTVASTMSYGEQRQLEIAMMLATEPDLLLLDEPLAGMGTEEAHQVTKLIKKLSEDHTIILIEHDMDAVFAVADALTVMVNGAVLETGTPEQIRSSKAVQEAYLGDEDEGH